MPSSLHSIIFTTGIGGHRQRRFVGGYERIAPDLYCRVSRWPHAFGAGQPGGVGSEAARGEMVESDVVLQVSDGILYLGVPDCCPWLGPSKVII